MLSAPKIPTAFPKSDAEPNPPTRLVNVPTEVMFGCAAVVTVPEVVAAVANGTVPVTFAPAIADRPAPEPMNTLP